MNSCDNSIPDNFGADPVNVKWTAVRGDTARLRIEFYQSDEVTKYDISTWTFLASTYDFKGDVSDTLTVVAGVGYVDIVASPTITSTWGTGYNTVATELAFDLQVTIGTEIWTPVIGKIVALADVTRNP